MADFYFTQTGEELQTLVNLVQNGFAREYDTATSYSAGDYCQHDGAFYKCRAATSGAWDASKWSAATLGGQLAQKATLSEINVYNSVQLGEAVAAAGDGSNVKLLSATLAAGAWLVIAGSSFSANASGYRQIGLSNSDTPAWSRMDVCFAAAESLSTNIQVMRLFSLPSGGTVTLFARQNSGASLNCYPFIHALKLR